MPDDKDLTRLSKILSLVLRHRPQELGLSLDENGWASVSDLLQKMNASGLAVDEPLLRRIVLTNDKKRFAFNDDETRIRASQGHSVSVRLEYPPAQPPAQLYHGTAQKNTASILAEGLKPQSRQQVHLSADADTARNVGSRHGKPVVLLVDAERMHKAGFLFFLSANGVWLTEAVPAAYLRPLP